MDHDAGLERKACARADVTSTGIGFAFDHEVTGAGDDAIRLRLMAGDGNNALEIETRIAKSEQKIFWEIPVLALQRALERYAGRFPIESRLEDLGEATPIYLTSEDFRDSDFEPADSWLAP